MHCYRWRKHIVIFNTDVSYFCLPYRASSFIALCRTLSWFWTQLFHSQRNHKNSSYCRQLTHHLITVHFSFANNICILSHARTTFIFSLRPTCVPFTENHQFWENEFVQIFTKPPRIVTTMLQLQCILIFLAYVRTLLEGIWDDFS